MYHLVHVLLVYAKWQNYSPSSRRIYIGPDLEEQS